MLSRPLPSSVIPSAQILFASAFVVGASLIGFAAALPRMMTPALTSAPESPATDSVAAPPARVQSIPLATTRSVQTRAERHGATTILRSPERAAIAIVDADGTFTVLRTQSDPGFVSAGEVREAGHLTLTDEGALVVIREGDYAWCSTPCPQVNAETTLWRGVFADVSALASASYESEEAAFDALQEVELLLRNAAPDSAGQVPSPLGVATIEQSVGGTGLSAPPYACLRTSRGALWSECSDWRVNNEGMNPSKVTYSVPWRVLHDHRSHESFASGGDAGEHVSVCRRQ